jgi:TetR/AcrR family fatty acid metabolism transcriptional regulator
VRTKTPFLAERMLDVAGRLFGSKRFHEVRMEDIAAEASVSKGTLYRYFRDKEELYLALLARASGQLVTEIKQRIAASDGCRQRLIALVDAILAFFDQQPHLLDLIQRAEIRQEQGAAFPWQHARTENLRMTLDIFEEAQSAGEFIIQHPHAAALMLLGGLRAILRFGERPRPETLATFLVDDFLKGAAHVPGRKRLTANAVS